MRGRVATVDLATVLRFVDLAVEALAAAREEIDALNVYPVPDGDTGTNMYLTWRRPATPCASGSRPATTPTSGRPWPRRSPAAPCSAPAATPG